METNRTHVILFFFFFSSYGSIFFSAFSFLCRTIMFLFRNLILHFVAVDEGTAAASNLTIAIDVDLLFVHLKLVGARSSHRESLVFLYIYQCFMHWKLFSYSVEGNYALCASCS